MSRFVRVAESVSRLVAIGAAAVLLAVLAYYGRPAWRPLPLAAALAALYGFGAARWMPRALGIGIALILAFPALFLLGTGAFYWPSHAVWLAMLLGAALAVPHGGWSCPAKLRLPLAAWSLIIAVSALLIAIREADFTALTLRDASVRNSGVPAVIIVQWIALTASAFLVGILWFDYLFATYATQPLDRFRSRVILPCALGWAANCVAATYQWRVDLQFPVLGFWAVMGRAPGLVNDANGAGAICAMWWPPLAAWGMSIRRRLVATVVTAAAVGLGWSSVWASASRGAIVLAIAGTLALAVVALSNAGKWRWPLALLTASALAAAAWIIVHSNPGTGVIERFAMTVRQTGSSPRTVLAAAWDRDGYGTVASRMIADHPIAGVGIGLFHTRVSDYPVNEAGARLPGDNAQNWYRHQLAEFGVLGTLGWVFWTIVVAVALLSAKLERHRYDLRVLRWMLLAFGLIHLVAMPGQEPYVAMTFWTLLFWFFHGQAASESKVENAFRSSAAWAVVWAIAIANLAVVGAQARGSMRPPVRAARLDADYSYGLQLAQHSGSMTADRAVMVPRATDKWLKLTYWVDHPDADEKRVRVDIWRDREHVVSRSLSRRIPVTQYVAVTPGKRFVLELHVNRTYRTQGLSQGESGLSFQWEFVSAAPAGN